MVGQTMSDELFGFMLLFTRIGSALMLMPGFGEPYIFSRSRLLFALVLSFILVVPLADMLPAMPLRTTDLVRLLMSEVVLGLFVGTATRVMFATLHIAGNTIAVQSGLATASSFDPSQSAQGTLPGNFLSTLAMVLLFVTDGHHMLLRGIAASYDHLRPGAPLPIDDMAAFITEIVQKGFNIGIQIAAPLIIVGLLVNLAMGVLNRLMPTFQVFFIALPLQLLLALATLMLSFTSGILIFFGFLDTHYGALTLGG